MLTRVRMLPFPEYGTSLIQIVIYEVGITNEVVQVHKGTGSYFPAFSDYAVLRLFFHKSSSAG
jgi:hypothetical protein